MKAKVVKVTFHIRVCVPDDATEFEISKLAQSEFLEDLHFYMMYDLVNEIIDDVENPYSPEMDGGVEPIDVKRDSTVY